MMNLSKAVKISTALDYADGSTDRKGASLDMLGFEGAMIVVKFAAIATGAVASVKVQQSAKDVDADFADLKGTAIAVADDDDNQVFIIDVYKPQKRFVRVYVDKDGANSTAEMAWYAQYEPREEPITQDVADEVTHKLLVSPAEGVA